MGYNPNQHRPDKSQTDYDERELPAGVYLLGPSWIQCPTEKSWKARFEALDGPFTGASCFIMQGRDISKQGTQARFFYYSQSADLDVEFDTNGSILTEDSLRQYLLGRAIKAKVSKKVENGYTNHNFSKFIPRSEWSSKELEIARKWETAFAERQDGAGGYSSDSVSDYQQDDPGPSGDEWGGSDGW